MDLDIAQEILTPLGYSLYDAGMPNGAAVFSRLAVMFSALGVAGVSVTTLNASLISYQLTNVQLNQDGHAVTGTFTFDTASSTPTAFNFSTTADASIGLAATTWTPANSSLVDTNNATIFHVLNSTTNAAIIITGPFGNAANITLNGSFPTVAINPNYPTGVSFFSSGTLTYTGTTGVTPEPGTGFFVVLGILCLIGGNRFRIS